MSLLKTARLLAKPHRILGGADPLKYLLRSCTALPTAQRWATFLLSNATLHELAKARPLLLFKPQRPYLRNNAPSQQKLTWLQDHFNWMLEQWPAAFLLPMYRQRGIELLTITGTSGKTYPLVLRPTEQCEKEGELKLVLMDQQKPLTLIGFTIYRQGNQWVADIGCLQGPRPSLGRDAVRNATHDMYGLRPKQLVLTALYALLTAYGIKTLRAVANDSHVYQAHAKKNERVSANYDSFWEEMHGIRPPDSNSYLLPPRMARKCMSEIASKKRAQYRRRQELEDKMIASLRAALPTTDANQAVFSVHAEAAQADPQAPTS